MNKEIELGDLKTKRIIVDVLSFLIGISIFLLEILQIILYAK